MIQNYLKIAVRNILKQKLSSFINISSLTIGLTATLLIFLFVSDELQYDQFNKNKNSIYRVLQVQHEVDGSLAYKGLSHAIGLGPEIVTEIPGIDQYVRFFSHWNAEDLYVRSGQKTIREKVLYGDFEVFDMFSFPVIVGTVKGNSPYEVVLTEQTASKYFGDNRAVGETLSIRIEDVFVDFTVTAIVENIPSNSSIQFDFLVNFQYLTDVGFLKEYVDFWGFGAIITYVRTSSNVTPASVQEGLDKILGSHYPNYANTAEQRGYKNALDYRHLELQALTDIHFDSTVTGGLVPSSNRFYSVILGLIAFGILLIGCINFMNLSIARSSNRTKEIGMRKSMGASRSQLIFQFLGESILLSIFALTFALLLAVLLLPTFNLLTAKEIELVSLLHPSNLLLISGVAISTGILAGLYPALMLANFKIDDALSGEQKLGGTNIFTRIMVVFQFTLSTFLIIGMLVMASQMRYIQNKNLGFQGEQVLVIPNNTINQTTIFSHYKNALVGNTGVLSISSADQTFGESRGLGGRGFEYKGTPMRVGIITVSDHYMETLGIDIIAGRSFNPELTSDYSNAVIVNEACMRDFQLELNGTFEDFARNPNDNPTVIGIMKDFNYNSLITPVMPMMIRFSREDQLGYVLVKISAENMPTTISAIREAWAEVAQDIPFEYTFLDDTMAVQYTSEKRWSKIISISMIMAIMLSCFGLFGLVAMAISAKRNEIGVRKVLGAEVKHIVGLYSWKYIKLVVIAFILASPVSYIALEQWLQTFAYRINLDLTIFLTAGIITIGIAFSTIIYKILEAALVNPASVLREE